MCGWNLTQTPPYLMSWMCLLPAPSSSQHPSRRRTLLGTSRVATTCRRAGRHVLACPTSLTCSRAYRHTLSLPAWPALHNHELLGRTANRTSTGTHNPLPRRAVSVVRRGREAGQALVPEGSDAEQAHGRSVRARQPLAREGGDADQGQGHLAPARFCRCSSGQGEARRLKLPRARAHRRRCCLLRRLHPAHDQAACGKQAGGGQPPRRGPSAVAAGASGLQLRSYRQPHPSIRRGRSSIRGAVDGAAHDRRGRPTLRKPKRCVGLHLTMQWKAPSVVTGLA